MSPCVPTCSEPGYNLTKCVSLWLSSHIYRNVIFSYLPLYEVLWEMVVHHKLIVSGSSFLTCSIPRSPSILFFFLQHFLPILSLLSTLWNSLLDALCNCFSALSLCRYTWKRFEWFTSNSFSAFTCCSNNITVF